MLQPIQDTLFDTHQVKVYVYRLDLIHPQVSGNKGYKLKYNLLAAKQQQKNTLLTFGGAYSNHIYATAAAGKEAGLRTIGVIRGEEHLPLNPTLQFATTAGMHLHYMDRSTYRNKKSEEVIAQLRQTFGDFYLVPEGGSNALAVKGCTEILPEINIDFDVVATACGTGGTLAGLVAHLDARKQVLGFPALKGGEFLYQDIAQLLDVYYAHEHLPDTRQSYALITDYHFGGYAKKKPALEQFIAEFQQKHRIPIEWIYTGKMFYGLYDLIGKGYFDSGTTIVALHTGGLR
ncbi:1-aminocyclopropane-1-carboxylate deaminase/D-cysteine desulfhydrase [Microscilla marina]|uniref:1-aminocyclopropane-1-carboxylate deaminase n=1 Tax=Microscilla marina ATCC 23134 TaxID=313606 RepID=A1ZQY3_MICM2|nr:pyridoxal-phosphate dependent enzyme [Microscilla marina]EAY27288.1 1-aminocyclopropane-1-carboxylate deaminase [Microscilla marina ATCC 23134]